jgi:hypothetical protein
MMGNFPGLTDTRWDMIVSAIGASVISFMGWRYLKRKRTFFVRDWIRKLIQRNPSLLEKQGSATWMRI